MKRRNKFIMGSAIGLATVAVAIDHTRHRLPEPVPVSQQQVDMEEESPCGMSSDSSPCGMDGDSSPCGLGE